MTEAEWKKNIKTEITNYTNECFYSFWRNRFSKISMLHSYQNDYELEVQKIDYDFLKDVLNSQLQNIAANSKKKFSSTVGKRKLITYSLDFPRIGNEVKFKSQLNVCLSNKKIFIGLTPGLPGYVEFEYFRYKNVLHIVSDLCNLDLAELKYNINSILKKYYINQKNAEIAKNSISNLCNSMLAGGNSIYRLYQYNLLSAVDVIDSNSNQLVTYKVIYREFNENPKGFIEFLKNHS